MKKYILRYLFIKRNLRKIKKEFNIIYKIDYYGAYYLNINYLVIVIIFENDCYLNESKKNGTIKEIKNTIHSLFDNRFDNSNPQCLFVSDEYIRNNFSGNYWMYYKSL